MSRILSADEAAKFQGFLNVHKPVGLISRRVVDRVLRVLRESGVSRADLPKVGHAGTLDPLASGVVVVCLGPATRFIDILHEHPKTYSTTFLFGHRSSTDDINGSVVEVDVERAARLTREELDAALVHFRGPIEQVPPDFSAVKIGGKSAYKFARRGKDVELAAKSVTIHRLDVVRFEPPELQVEIECSTGTYIRSIGRDLGDRLGCGAVTSALCRTQAGPFLLSESLDWAQINPDNFAAHLLPCAYATRHLKGYVCNAFEQTDLAHGAGIKPRDEAWTTQPLVTNDSSQKAESFAMLNSTGELIAVGGWDATLPVLRPRINLIGIS